MKNIKDLIGLINEFSEQVFAANPIYESIGRALKIFYEALHSKYASLFILNEETLVFDFRAVYPSIAKSLIIADFNRLVDIGVVGKAVENRDMLFYELKNLEFENSYYLLFPLLAPNSIIAIVLVRLESKSELEKELFLPTLKFYANLFSFLVRNNQLENSLDKANSLLEQRIAARTLSLIQGKRELQEILDSIQSGVMIIDTLTNRIISVNPAAANLLEAKYEKIVGNAPSVFFNSDEEKKEETANYIKFSRNFESEIKNSKAEIIPILRTSANVTLKDRKYRIESFLDITEQKMAEIALKQSNELLEMKVQERTEDLQILIYKLQNEIKEREKAEEKVREMLDKEKELNKLKTRFVSMVSHEFKTPLTVISTSVELLEQFYNSFSSEEREEYFTRISKSIDLMKSLIENVLFIGKSEADNLNIAPDKINLKNLCSKVIEDIKLTLKKRREFIFDYNASNTHVYLDEKLIEPMLINLLNNAIKYSEEGPVELRVLENCDNLIISVKDYGIGIPAEEQEKIFEAFHRANNVGNISGTGLGMSIILKAVELHKGQINIISGIDTGTTFTITIPKSNIMS
ncbi:MAG: PAS domain-containing sensor histidine kinase [Ignavibacteria bacterium]|nr:PAS domain-containing sensor histidine kinase [Ignavibacteria bacterium]